MHCPYCHTATNVTNSRATARNTQVWRRRQCKKCQSIWTTHEVINLSKSHTINNPETGTEPFSRDKLFTSIKDSLQHRKDTLAAATGLTDTVIGQVLALKTADVSLEQILKLTHATLKRYDSTAAAVYKATHRA